MSGFDFFRTLTNDTDLTVNTLTCDNLTVNNNLDIASDLKVDGILKADVIAKDNSLTGIQFADRVGVLKAPTASYAIDVSGGVNVTGTGSNFYINGTAIAGSKWTDLSGNIYRNSNVGIGDFSASSVLYALQLGPVNTLSTADKTLAIPVGYNRRAAVRMSECGPSGLSTEAGFELALDGTNNRFEIMSGNNASAGAAFSTRCFTADRDTGYACFGSVTNLSYPLSVASGATLSRQLNIVGGANASLAVNNANGNVDVAIAQTTGSFSSDALIGDAIIRQSTASRKLMLQCGTAGSAICIDNANNVGIAKATGLGSYKLDVLGGIGSQNSNVTCYTNTTTSSAGFRVLLSGQTTRTGLFGTGTAGDTGFQLIANDALAVTANSVAQIGIGTAPHTSYRLNVDGSARIAGNMDVVGGNQYRVSGVQLNTSHIPESTNLYYTTARATTDARAAISVSATAPLNLTYDNTTGALTGSITGSAISKWTDAVSGGVYRNSRIAVNYTDTLSSASIYSRTDPANSITAGLYIESPTTSGAQIVQKTSAVTYALSASSAGYKIINQTPASNNNWIGVNTDGSFELYNGNTANGTELKFFDGTNLGVAGTGAEIFYGPSTDRTLYFINQEFTSSNGVQIWMRDAVGNLAERWRFAPNSSLTNRATNTSTRSLDVSGDVQFGTAASPNYNVFLGTSGVGTTQAAYISGSLNNMDIVNMQSGTLRLGTNNGLALNVKHGTTESALEIGNGRTSNAFAYVDLIGDATYTDYGLRLQRGNTGANSDSQLIHRGTGLLTLSATDAGAITLRTSASERMRILSGGNVGVNEVAPEERFQVTVATSNYGLLTSDGTRKWGIYLGGNSNASIGTKTNHSWGFFTNNGTVTAYFSVSSFFATAFTVISDERIKKDIEDIDDEQALVLLRQLTPKSYKYIDPQTNNGVEDRVWGFLSQEVAKVIPYSVIPQTGIIPNIMKPALATQISNDQIKITSAHPIDVAVDDIIEIRNGSFGRTVRVAEVIDPYNFTVDNSESILTRENDPITVVGKQVNDKLFLKKDAIYTVHVAATQQLDRELQEAKAHIQQLEDKVARLEKLVDKLLMVNNLSSTV